MIEPSKRIKPVKRIKLTKHIVKISETYRDRQTMVHALQTIGRFLQFCEHSV
jgi:hypothetical protein